MGREVLEFCCDGGEGLLVDPGGEGEFGGGEGDPEVLAAADVAEVELVLALVAAVDGLHHAGEELLDLVLGDVDPDLVLYLPLGSSLL